MCCAVLGPFHLAPLVSAHSWFGLGHLQWWMQQNPAGFVLARASSPTQLCSLCGLSRGAGLVAMLEGKYAEGTPKRGKLEPQAGYGPGTSLRVKHCRQLLLISPQSLCLQSRTHCQRHCAPKVSPVQNNPKVAVTPKEFKDKSLGRRALAWLH